MSLGAAYGGLIGLCCGNNSKYEIFCSSIGTESVNWLQWPATLITVAAPVVKCACNTSMLRVSFLDLVAAVIRSFSGSSRHDPCVTIS